MENKANSSSKDSLPPIPAKNGPACSEDAEHYGTPMVNRDRVIQALGLVVPGCPRRLARPGVAGLPGI